MANVRKIKVASSRIENGRVEIETSAKTYGEFKRELYEKHPNFDVSGMKGLVRETGSSLELDEAQLPMTDITVLFTPTKTDSGAEDLSEKTDRELRALCSEYGLRTRGTKAEKIDRVEAYLLGKEDSAATLMDENTGFNSDLAERSIACVEGIKEVLKANGFDASSVVIDEETRKLVAEAKMIADKTAVNCGGC